MFSATECACLHDCHALPYSKQKIIFNRPCILSYGHNYKAIIVQQLATEYIFFKFFQLFEVFRIVFYPSSGNHNNVPKLCCIYETLTVNTV